MIIQNAAALFAAPQIAQTTVIGILIASSLIVVVLIGFIGILAWRTEPPLDTTERPLLEYGHFILVLLGILATLIGFLVAVPLLVRGAQVGVLIIPLLTT